MKKISLVTFVALAVMLIASAIPAVSASIVDTEISEWVDTAVTGTQQSTSGMGGNGGYTGIQFRDISRDKSLSYIVFELPGDYGQWIDSAQHITPGRHDFEYTFNGKTRPGVLYLAHSTNLLGQITNTKMTIFLNDWDTGLLTGAQYVPLPFRIYEGTTSTAGTLPPNAYAYSPGMYAYPDIPITVTEVSGIPWINRLKIDELDSGYEINLQRVIDNQAYKSTILVNKTNEIIYQSTLNGQDELLWFAQQDIDSVSIISPSGKAYQYPLNTASMPNGDEVSIYIRNSQTGALLANAHINISANVDGNFHEVVNKTSPSGMYSIELQPTGGGMPNPDFYRLIPTAEGYNSIMPYIDFEVDGATTIYAYLDPIGGAPEDENNTFIDFFVRDMSANPISGATVNFGGYTLITNSAGYAIFEVDKNNTYTWIVSKSGYGSLTGNVVIGADPRHTINTVLAPAVTPTTPTPIPTSTSISPNPTMTAPTGEPVSNWLEWFAAHFGRILGGGVEIGKIFMWLCFSVPVGVYVAKEAKAGAAGFVAGAGVVTLFFVLIGWVPIWLLVLMALIIGLLYAKIFNNSDTGGGR